MFAYLAFVFNLGCAALSIATGQFYLLPINIGCAAYCAYFAVRA